MNRKKTRIPKISEQDVFDLACRHSLTVLAVVHGLVDKNGFATLDVLYNNHPGAVERYYVAARKIVGLLERLKEKQGYF